MNTHDGYKKANRTDASVLLALGGDLPLDEFLLKVEGGIVTGNTKFNYLVADSALFGNVLIDGGLRCNGTINGAVQEAVASAKIKTTDSSSNTDYYPLMTIGHNQILTASEVYTNPGFFINPSLKQSTFKTAATFDGALTINDVTSAKMSWGQGCHNAHYNIVLNGSDKGVSGIAFVSSDRVNGVPVSDEAVLLQWKDGAYILYYSHGTTLTSIGTYGNLPTSGATVFAIGVAPGSNSEIWLGCGNQNGLYKVSGNQKYRILDENNYSYRGTSSRTLTTSWLSLGLSANNFNTGTFIVEITIPASVDAEVQGFRNFRCSGIFSCTKVACEDTVITEIPIHQSATKSNKTLSLAMMNANNGWMSLGMKSNVAFTEAVTFLVTLKKLF